MKKTTPLAIGLSGFLAGCVSTPLVEKLEYDSATGFSQWNGEGVVYSLPKTKIDMTFEVNRTTFEKPYCPTNLCDKAGENGKCTDNDEEKYKPENVLKTLQVKKNATDHDGLTVYSITSGTAVSKPVVDKEKVFVTRLPESSFFANSSLVLNMDESGLIESLDVASTSKAVEFATKVVELGFSVATSGVPLGASEFIALDNDKKISIIKECQKLIDKYIEVEAEINKYKTQPFPYPADTVEKYQADWRIELASLKEKFIGKASSKNGKAFCGISPESDKDGEKHEKDKEYELFEFSAMEGFHQPEDDKYCDFSSNDFEVNTVLKGPKKSIIKLHVKKVESLKSQEENWLIEAYAKQTRDNNYSTKPGLYYNVPEKGTIQLTGHRKIDSELKIIDFPQFGSLRYLPQISGYSPALVVSLHKDTGALKSIKVSNSAADLASVVGSISTGRSQYMAAKVAQRDKDAAQLAEEKAKQDTLAVLTRKKSILEALVAIEVAEDALDAYAESQTP